MFYLFYGEDEFSREGAVGELRRGVGPPEVRDINVTDLDAREATADQVIALCSTVPFMTPRRLVVLRGLLSRFERRGASGGEADGGHSGTARSWDALWESVALFPDSTDLVLVEGRIAPGSPLLRKVQAIATTRTFPSLRGERLRGWIRKRAEEKDAKITPEAVNGLADLSAGNLRVLDGELDKLALYAAGRAICQEDVEVLVAFTGEASIFVAVDAVVEGRPEVALRALRRLLDGGNSPGFVLAMIARQVRLLLLAKDLKRQGVPVPELGGRLRLSGYPLRKTLDQETMFTQEGLHEAHSRLVQADLSAKTGRLDEETALELLVTELATTGPRSSRR